MISSVLALVFALVASWAPAPATESLPEPAPVVDDVEVPGPATDSPMCFADWQGYIPADQPCWDPETGEVRLPGADGSR